MVDDAAILEAVDVVWLTVPAIHKRLGYRGLAHELSIALRRLAVECRVETTSRNTVAPHYRPSAGGKPKCYSIHCYRRLETVQPIVAG